MSVDKDTVRRIAKLARLAVPENRLESAHSGDCGVAFMFILRLHGSAAQDSQQLRLQGFHPGGTAAHGRKGGSMVHVAPSLAEPCPALDGA